MSGQLAPGAKDSRLNESGSSTWGKRPRLEGPGVANDIDIQRERKDETIPPLLVLAYPGIMISLGIDEVRVGVERTEENGRSVYQGDSACRGS